MEVPGLHSTEGDRAAEYRGLAAALEAPHDPTAPVTVVNPLAAVITKHVQAAALRVGGGQGQGSASPFAVNVAAPELATSGGRGHGQRPSVELAASGRSWPPPARGRAYVEGAGQPGQPGQPGQAGQQTRARVNTGGALQGKQTFDCENPMSEDKRERSIELRVVRRIGSASGGQMSGGGRLASTESEEAAIRERQAVRRGLSICEKLRAANRASERASVTEHTGNCLCDWYVFVVVLRHFRLFTPMSPPPSPNALLLLVCRISFSLLTLSSIFGGCVLFTRLDYIGGIALRAASRGYLP